MIKRLKEELSIIRAKSPGTVCAIDIGEYLVKLALAKENNGQLQLTEFYSSEVAQPANEEHLVSALEKTLQNLPEKPQEIYLAINSDDITIKNLSLPQMPPAELKNAISWEAKTNQGIEIESSYWDFFVSGEKEEDGARKLDIILASAPKDKINHWVNILKKLDIITVGITAPAFCLEKLISLDNELTHESVAIVDIGYHHTNIVLSQQGKLKFIRQMSTAGDSITKAMTGALVSDMGRVELTMKDAEDVKRLYGLPDVNETGLIAGKIPAIQLSAMIKLVLERLTSDIKRSFDYYNEELKGEEVDKLLLSGGGSKLKNLTGFIREHLGTETEILKLPDNILAKNKEFDPAYAVVTGLVFDQAKSINLAPPGIKNTRTRIVEKLITRISIFTFSMVLAVSYLLLGAEARSLNMRIEANEKTMVVASEMVKLKETLNQCKSVVNYLHQGEKLIPEALKALSHYLPYPVVFENITYQPDGKLNITGQIIGDDKATHQGVMADYLGKLNSSGIFKNARLVSSRRESSGEKPVSSFELSAEIAY